MGVKRRYKREIQRMIAKRGTDEVLKKLNVASVNTEKTILNEQKEHARTISALMMAVPTLVLVRDMKWKPLEGTVKDNRRGIREFAEKLMQEIERIDADPKFKIEEYCEEVYEKTGVRYNYSKEGTA